MIVYRLTKGAFKNDLTGKGAELCGARWNSKGTAMLFTSESRALCMLEICVHLPLHLIPDDYHMVTINCLDSDMIRELSLKYLPVDWQTNENVTKRIGDRFIKEGAYLALKVPSIIVSGDFNYVFNPFHQDFNSIKIIDTVPFSFDKRLFEMFDKE